jgi:hypothetical protein
MFDIIILTDKLLNSNFLIFLILNLGLFLHWVLFFKFTNYQELKNAHLKENLEISRIKDFLVLLYVSFPFLCSIIFLIIVS